MVGALAGRERRAPGQRLGEREQGVVGLARADEEADRSGPVLALERGLEQVVGGRSRPRQRPPSLIAGRRSPRAPPRRCRGGVAQGRGRVGRVDHPPAVVEVETIRRHRRRPALRRGRGRWRATAGATPGPRPCGPRAVMTSPRRRTPTASVTRLRPRPMSALWPLHRSPSTGRQ